MRTRNKVLEGTVVRVMKTMMVILLVLLLLSSATIIQNVDGTRIHSNNSNTEKRRQHYSATIPCSLFVCLLSRSSTTRCCSNQKEFQRITDTFSSYNHHRHYYNQCNAIDIRLSSSSSTSSSLSLSSSSSSSQSEILYNKNNDSNSLQRQSSSSSTSTTTSDRRDVLTLLSGCFLTATTISTYEDYDVTHLHPSRGALRRYSSSSDSIFGPSYLGAATKGMGSSKEDRLVVRQSFDETTSFDQKWNSQDIQSYNEIMEEHRNGRVKRWKQLYRNEQQEEETSASNHESIINAVGVLYKCLYRINNTLKPAASDYQWEFLKEELSSKLWRMDLEEACTYLMYASLEGNGNSKSDSTTTARRETIGNDWGSCAWRHCGALADIQEVLAELYNSLGMLEPYETLFCLDIAERSLRDILDVTPQKYKQEALAKTNYQIPPYQPYVTQGDAYDGLASLEGIDGGSDSSKELGNPQFLNILNMLKQSQE